LVRITGVDGIRETMERPPDRTTLRDPEAADEELLIDPEEALEVVMTKVAGSEVAGYVCTVALIP
jgi:hypothetical protein